MKEKHRDPIVELYLNSDPDPSNTIRIFKELPQPLPPEASAIVALEEALRGKRSVAQAMQEAERAYSQESDIDAHILLLIFWVRFLAFSGHSVESARLLTEQLGALLSPSTHPILRSWSNAVIAFFAFQSGDLVKSSELWNSLLNDIPKSSPHYLRLRVLQDLMYNTVGTGYGTPLLSPEEIEKLGDVSKKRIVVTAVTNAALTGNWENAFHYIKQTEGYSTQDMAMALAGFESPGAISLIQLMREVIENKQNLLPLSSFPFARSAESEWITSTRYLLAGHVAQALDWARQYEQKPRSRRSVIGFDEYCLIRSELAAKNANAARRLLSKRIDAGSKHYMDDLFSARLEYLEGNISKACSYFKSLSESIEHYKAQGRLELELQLAHELSPLDLIKLQKLTASESTAEAEVNLREGATVISFPVPKEGTHRIITQSPNMLSLKESLPQIANADIPVLIIGETGAGKEVFARAIHDSGPRKSKEFLAINCSSLSDTLVGSELFGHKRGAFTGADRTRSGLFREAGEGTLFLDEIGDISPRMQVSLLRVLETGEVRPLGGSERYHIRCGIIAATNAELEAKVDQGTFRADLMYRLQRLQVALPPLRERGEDTLLLAEFFLNEGRPGGTRASLSQALCQELQNQPWHGNVRELRYVIERMRLFNSDKLFYDVDDFYRVGLGQQQPSPIQSHQDFAPQIEAPRSSSITTSPTSHTAAAQAPELSGGIKALQDIPSGFRKKLKLRKLIEETEEIKVVEVSKLFNVSRATASRYLKELAKEGLIEKIEPNRSPRSHFYRRKTLKIIS